MKWIGCAIIFFSIMQIGLKKVEKLRYGIALLSDVWYAVTEIGRQIGVAQTPLPLIYRDLAKNAQGKSQFFQKLYAAGDFCSAYESIKASIVAPKALEQTMERFLRLLGKTDVTTQCANCREAAEQLSQVLTSEQASFQQKRKMYLSVAACVGGMLVLFML